MVLPLPLTQGYVFGFGQVETEGGLGVAEQLAANGTALRQQFGRHLNVVHRAQPAVTVADEQAFAGNVGEVRAHRMPRPLLEQNGVARFGADFDCAVGVRPTRFLRGASGQAIATGNKADIPPPRFTQIR